jgi:hypothetical protein
VSRPDLDGLTDTLIAFAERMLEKQKSFIPFGAAMSADGSISAVAGDVGKERPEAQEVIEFLTAAFRAQATAGTIRASGICIDVRTIPPGQADKTDAILARLEHKDGEAIDVYLPYRKPLLGKVKYGELFATRGTPQIFAAGAV